MKKIVLILAITAFNLSLVSCTKSDISDDVTVEEYATDGEGEEILPKDD